MSPEAEEAKRAYKREIWQAYKKKTRYRRAEYIAERDRQIAEKGFYKEECLLTNEAKEAQRTYKREWQRANRDKVRAQQERYWEKRAQMAKEQGQAQAEKEG